MPCVAPLDSLHTALPPPSPPPGNAERCFTPAALLASRAGGEQLVLIGDSVYDVASLFAPGAHPGGAEVLAEVIGGDATDQFANSHPEWVRARLAPLRVGPVRD